jgi:predicted PurR-regulated permease PerM
MQVVGALVLIALSLILAAVLVPLVAWLERHRVPRGLAALIGIAIVVIIILTLLGLVIPPLVIQGIQLANTLPELLDRWRHTLERYPDVLTSLEGVVTKVREDPGAVFTGILRFGVGAATTIFGGILLLTLTLYFLIDRVRIHGAVIRQVPAAYRERADRTLRGVASMCRAYFVGQLVLSALFAIGTFVLLTILGAPFAAILAALAFFLEAIANIGSLVAISLAFLLALTQSLTAAIIAAVVLIVYNQLENYVISPKVLSGRLKVPPVLTMIAILLGGELFGILGIIIAVPLAGAVPVIERIWFPRGIGNS